MDKSFFTDLVRKINEKIKNYEREIEIIERENNTRDEIKKIIEKCEGNSSNLVKIELGTILNYISDETLEKINLSKKDLNSSWRSLALKDEYKGNIIKERVKKSEEIVNSLYTYLKKYSETKEDTTEKTKTIDKAKQYISNIENNDMKKHIKSLYDYEDIVELFSLTDEEALSFYKSLVVLESELLEKEETKLETKTMEEIIEKATKKNPIESPTKKTLRIKGSIPLSNENQDRRNFKGEIPTIERKKVSEITDERIKERFERFIKGEKIDYFHDVDPKHLKEVIKKYLEEQQQKSKEARKLAQEKAKSSGEKRPEEKNENEIPKFPEVPELPKEPEVPKVSKTEKEEVYVDIPGEEELREELAEITATLDLQEKHININQKDKDKVNNGYISTYYKSSVKMDVMQTMIGNSNEFNYFLVQLIRGKIHSILEMLELKWKKEEIKGLIEVINAYKEDVKLLRDYLNEHMKYQEPEETKDQEPEKYEDKRKLFPIFLLSKSGESVFEKRLGKFSAEDRASALKQLNEILQSDPSVQRGVGRSRGKMLKTENNGHVFISFKYISENRVIITEVESTSNPNFNPVNILPKDVEELMEVCYGDKTSDEYKNIINTSKEVYERVTGNTIELPDLGRGTV